MPTATQNPRLRFGLWVDFRNPPQWLRPYKDLYAETLEMIAWAENIGYDDVWLSEHHFVDDGYSPAQMPIAAAIAVKTKKIRIGTSVVLLPMYDPVRLAEDGATVDILSDGRFELGAGLGYRAGEFEGLGLKYKERAGRMNEALEIIRRLWEGETLTFHGKHFHIEGARVSPEPVQKPRPPIWVGGFAAAATRRAARYGDGYIAINEVRPSYDNYVAELRALGKDPAQAHVIAGSCMAGGGERSRQNLARAGAARALPDQPLRQMDGRFGTGLFSAHEHGGRVAQERPAQRGNARAGGRADPRLRLAHPDRALLHLDLPAGLSAEKDVRAPGVVREQGDAAFSRLMV